MYNSCSVIELRYRVKHGSGPSTGPVQVGSGRVGSGPIMWLTACGSSRMMQNVTLNVVVKFTFVGTI